ncbi:hypothetical protein DJ568_16125 [Mucilaginibacter hurinus]|uniref:Carboxypeptidase regulatory-like domain-containing protein n=1 Tax=Mucilaginibacter hurinus TaxID=2201324 RepID=A0A367GJW4_9SPHI|nr:carboxypeptidase-like regulatory domain-containing protein [Mucilaginibacter hurinus]RCH53764.1 hypothetical protein DJ568_16125 [Mucilaginibacter hurinus]
MKHFYKGLILFALVLVVSLSLNLKAQNIPPDLRQDPVSKTDSIPLHAALDSIKKLYKVSLLFVQQYINDKYASAEFDRKQPLEQLLDQVLSPQNLSYKKISENYYSIFRGDAVKVNTTHRRGTFSISGVVKGENGEKMPGTIVFVSGSKYITAADANGVYRLDGLTSGNYELAAKMIGYENFRQTVNVNQKSVLVNITLRVSATLLDEVVIVSQVNRQKYLETFTKYFIGQSANASKCSILNPDVLNFRYQKSDNTLHASADDFLLIENRGLGYRLKYLLNKFEFNYNTELLYYNGSPYFEELIGTGKQIAKWKQNRDVAFNGSVRHFFRSVFNNTLKEEGYAVYESKDRDKEKRASISDIYSLWDISRVNNDFVYVKPKAKLYVLFGREDSGTYDPKAAFGQSSMLKPLQDSVLIDRNGSFASKGFLFNGYWSWENVAEMVPVDYKMDHEQPTHSGTIAFQNSVGSPAMKLITAIDSFAVRMPSEKVYLHIDKPYYTNTDTIWLKSYVLNGSLGGSEQSGLLYAELVNDTGRVVLRQSMPVLMGISWGQIALDSVGVPEGSYTLRAYTNWMQNQGEESFFTRQLYISKTDAGSWLVKAGSKTDIRNGKENTEVALQLLGQDGGPVRLQDLELKLRDGNKTRLREKMQTDIEGKLRFNFDVPAKAGRLKLVAEDKSGKRIVFPLNLNRDENADVQFMPEGGSLVAGLTSKVGFKAIGEDGRGINVSGVITDSKGNEVAAFKNGYKGMGYFVLTPAENESYMARVKLPKGQIKSYPLPPVKPSGMVLTVNNVPGRDSVILSVQATPVVLGSYSLIGQSGGKVYYASTVSFKPGTHMINGRIAKSKFPTGVARFTLFGNTNQAVAERIVFIDHHDRLQISIDTDKQHYQPNDSVSLAIKVTDHYNNPVQGSFSLAVTDDSQVKADSTNVPDISSYMLLQSELKGDIEEPGYYFTNPNAETALQLDNLMLTQGWVGYDWKDVFAPTNPPKYRAEKEIEVSGIVKRLNKPQPGLQVSVFTPKMPIFFRDTLTNNQGQFSFNGLPKLDTPAYLVKVKDKRGKLFESVIEMNEFTPPSLKKIPYADVMPWYINSDTVMRNHNRLNVIRDKNARIIQAPGATALKEVVIKAKKIVRNSKNLNGPGNADQVLDEEDIIKSGKISLIELLSKRIKGFGSRVLPTDPRKDPSVKYYSIYQNQVKFVFDGEELDLRFEPLERNRFRDFEHFAFVQSALSPYNSADIKGIEVLYSDSYTSKYKMAYEPDAMITPSYEHLSSGSSIRGNLNNCIYCTPPRYGPLVYVEITTWSGAGLAHHRTSGVSTYRPLPVNWPKQFYRPKYASIANSLFNLRSTVHWQPDIFTDAEGKAMVSFYTKSKKASYTLILQGANLNGNIGDHKKRIIVTNNTRSK